MCLCSIAINDGLSHKGFGERLIQHEAKPSAVLGLRPTPECYFLHIEQTWQCFKAFLVDT